MPCFYFSGKPPPVIHQDTLTSALRIAETLNAFSAHGVVQTSLIAPQARPDIIPPAFCSLSWKFRVCQHRPSKHGEIHIPPFNQFLSHLHIHTVTHHDRNRYRPAYVPSKIAVYAVRQIHGYLRHTAFMPSTCNTDRVHPCLFRHDRYLAGLFIGVAPCNKIASAHTDGNRNLFPYLPTHGANRFHKKTGSVLQAASILIRAYISQGRQELPKKIS